MNTAWIVLGLVFILVVIDWMIGRHTIKRCERIKDISIESIGELWPIKLAEVDDLLNNSLRIQNEEIIKELRKETAGMKEWVDEMLRGTADIIKDITDQANTNMQIVNDNIKIANGLINKPAELKLTVNFKGQK